MPDLLGRARGAALGIVRSAMLNEAISQTADLLAGYLDRNGISPADLEAAILHGRADLLKAALAEEAKPSEIATVRRVFGGIASEFRREHRAPDGTPWHPYKSVLQEEVMSIRHKAHVAVLERHQRWYRAQMDAAVSWLFGTLPPGD